MNTLPENNKISCSAMNILKYQLQDFLAEVKKETGIPGICLALAVGGESMAISVGTLSTDSLTPINEYTHFQLGCISKLLTAIIAAEFISAGELDPDDPIEKHLIELRGTDRGKDLAIWHLLSHTSGYRGLNITDPGVAYYFSWPKFLKYLNTAPQLFKPGSVFSYEHSEYVILGEIIKRISGKNIIDLYHEMIFGPLKLTAGSIKENQRGKEVYTIDHRLNPDTMKFTKLKAIPFGGFWNASLNSITMNMSDLLRIASSVCGITKIRKSLPEKAMKFVRKQVVKLPRTYGSTRHEQVPVTFGAGCASYRGWLLGHNGSARGQTCGLRFDPRSNTALAIGINAWQPFIRDSIINRVFELIRGQPIPSFAEDPFESSLDDLTGNYIGPQDFEISVACANRQLICKSNSKPPVTILMKKDENNLLRVCSDTQHNSLGFFNEPCSGIKGLMLGMSAFREKYPF
ncbi:serine hydrolase domain-containing protein [Thermodesulfobacteriota bacterium]